MRGQIAFLPAVLQKPGARGAGVLQRFGGAKAFGGNDEKRARRLQRSQRGGQLVPVHVGHEVDARPARAHMILQRLQGQARAEVRAANADVNHVGKAPLGADAFGQRQHGVKLLHALAVVGLQRGGRSAGRAAQQRVQGRAAFGVVHGLAA